MAPTKFLCFAKAAMYSGDGRGEKSLLEELVYEHFGTRDFFKIVIDFTKDLDARRHIAAVSRLTSRAAAEGDAVAIGIYEYAGREMAHQLCTAIARDEARWNGKVTIVGGAWKGSPVMYDVFCREVSAKYPRAEITKPLFEPLIGCVAKRLCEEGRDVEALRPRFLEAFANYRYKF
jgi:N-acetylglucosamine kinase-like BadF-type ATPase